MSPSISEAYLNGAPEPQLHSGVGQHLKMYPPPVDDVLHDGSKYKPAGKLEGKKAIVTGSDSGIGRSTALLFALEGAHLTLQYLPEEQADMDDVIQLIKDRAPKCNVIALALDFTSKADCERLVTEHVKHHGSLDTLVLNHGTQKVQDTFEELSAEQWLNTFDVNIHSFFFIAHAAVPHMPPGSTIAMNASVNHFKGHPKLIDYTATKGAMVGFSRALSNSIVETKGIRVNVVAPGPIWTPLIVATMTKEMQEGFGKNVPMQRPGQPIEVATCFVFLCSPDSGYISGQVLHPNGGNVVA